MRDGCGWTVRALTTDSLEVETSATVKSCFCVKWYCFRNSRSAAVDDPLRLTLICPSRHSVSNASLLCAVAPDSSRGQVALACYSYEAKNTLASIIDPRHLACSCPYMP